MTSTTYAGKWLANYDADFYNWTIDRKLGDCRNLWISDIDGLVRDRAGNMLLLEIKRRNYEPKPYQMRNMAILNAILEAGIKALGGKVTITQGGTCETHNIAFHGFKLLQLSGDSFYNSSFTVNGEPVSADNLVKLLSFADSPHNASRAPMDRF